MKCIPKGVIVDVFQWLGFDKGPQDADIHPFTMAEDRTKHINGWGWLAINDQRECVVPCDYIIVHDGDIKRAIPESHFRMKYEPMQGVTGDPEYTITGDSCHVCGGPT